MVSLLLCPKIWRKLVCEKMRCHGNKPYFCLFFWGICLFFWQIWQKNWSSRLDNSKTNWARDFALKVHRLLSTGPKKWRTFWDPPVHHVVMSAHFLPKNPIFSTIWAKIGLHGNRPITKMFATITNKSELFNRIIIQNLGVRARKIDRFTPILVKKWRAPSLVKHIIGPK